MAWHRCCEPLPASNSRRLHRSACSSSRWCCRRPEMHAAAAKAANAAHRAPEHCLEPARTRGASRRGPPPQAGAEPGRCRRAREPIARAPASRAAVGSDRSLRTANLVHSSRRLRAPPSGEALSRHLNKKTLVLLRNGPKEARKPAALLSSRQRTHTQRAVHHTKKWPKSRRARRASARERPPRR